MRIKEGAAAQALRSHVVHGIPLDQAAKKHSIEPRSLIRSSASCTKIKLLLTELCALDRNISTQHLSIMAKLMRLRSTPTSRGVEMVLLGNKTPTQAGIELNIARSSIARQALIVRQNINEAFSANFISIIDFTNI